MCRNTGAYDPRSVSRCLLLSAQVYTLPCTSLRISNAASTTKCLSTDPLSKSDQTLEHQVGEVSREELGQAMWRELDLCAKGYPSDLQTRMYCSVLEFCVWIKALKHEHFWTVSQQPAEQSGLKNHKNNHCVHVQFRFLSSRGLKDETLRTVRIKKRSGRPDTPGTTCWEMGSFTETLRLTLSLWSKWRFAHKSIKRQ